jgi:hypothetical protein
MALILNKAIFPSVLVRCMVPEFDGVGLMWTAEALLSSNCRCILRVLSIRAYPRSFPRMGAPQKATLSRTKWRKLRGGVRQRRPIDHLWRRADAGVGIIVFVN